MKVDTCRDCGTKIGRWYGQPGRPPVRCEPCREKLKKDTVKVKIKLTPQEQVERLENNLKASGLHISQNREDEESA